MRLKESLCHVLDQAPGVVGGNTIPEALCAIQDVLVTLTSLLVAEANVVSLADWSDSWHLGIRRRRKDVPILPIQLP